MSTGLLFHKDVFFPKGINEACKNLQKAFGAYSFSRHLTEHFEDQPIENRSHKYEKDIVEECLSTLRDTQRDVFEVEMTYSDSGWDITKYCCRIPYDEHQDVVVAIRPRIANHRVIGNLVVTAWMNARDDSHTTLDKSKYCSEEEWKQANGK